MEHHPEWKQLCNELELEISENEDYKETVMESQKDRCDMCFKPVDGTYSGDILAAWRENGLRIIICERCYHMQVNDRKEIVEEVLNELIKAKGYSYEYKNVRFIKRSIDYYRAGRARECMESVLNSAVLYMDRAQYLWDLCQVDVDFEHEFATKYLKTGTNLLSVYLFEKWKYNDSEVSLFKDNFSEWYRLKDVIQLMESLDPVSLSERDIWTLAEEEFLDSQEIKTTSARFDDF